MRNFAALVAFLFLGASTGAWAQDNGDGPGAYASPSGIPDAALNEKFGIPDGPGRSRYRPIELPNMPDSDLNSFSAPNLPAFPDDAFAPTGIDTNALTLTAKLGADGDAIPDGVVWRLFSTRLNREGKLQLIGVAKGGQANFNVGAGSYLLHAGYGRAGITKRIEFSGLPTTETVVIEAGGLRLNATTGDGQLIDSRLLTFDIYTDAEQSQNRRLIANNVKAGVVVRLNAGNYYIVCNYGSVNAIVRAEIRVESGRVTDARLKQRAAEITLKLVRESGGEALADTAWSISSSQGDIIRESVGAFSSMVLAEGEYVIVAKNKDRIYQMEYNVAAGMNEEVEVVANGNGNSNGSPAQNGSGDDAPVQSVPAFEELEQAADDLQQPPAGSGD
ncbi:hypothetical protein FPY71_09065 [Aureimonas fodinaquatilis]|uniref:Uncharacterized protein n=1 Tax=Aureimonas fodinaquatilis TaxID=2565783 RepID=A0A5B0DUZ7_9HYPH|nr:hypothetical protein [Aureimonas fodinaquatilis]KAA0970637.1 hypothetical protein FPY71_09065 [Aureimonas fodinaquatilis]